MGKNLILVAAILGGAAVAQADGSVGLTARPVPGYYLVGFKTEPFDFVATEGEKPPSVDDRVRELAILHGAEVQRTFRHALQGAVLRLSARKAHLLAMNPDIAFVEEDGIITVAGSQSDPPSWGLDRLDQRLGPLDGMYTYNNGGAGVVAYVVDSGIRSTHLDFEGRVDVANSFTTVNDGLGAEDCHGHGTMVAGLVGGATFGVAKEVTLRSMRMLNCAGVGTVSDVVAGLDWIVARQTPAPKVKGKTQPPPPPPAVINLSVRIPGSAAVDAAVQSALSVGVTVVAAAGNDGGDACGYSPGRLPSVLTVAASNAADNVWAYTNGGPCVKVFAPGVAVVTTTMASDTSWGYFTGTSAAAPHVAGTVALYLAAAPQATPADVQGYVIADSTPGVLALVPDLSPNRLLFSAQAGLDRAPVARFTFSCRSGRCSFDASASSDDHGIVGYTWNFGDGTSGSGRTVTHRFPNGSAFLVSLTVTDSAGQTATTSQTVLP